MFAYCVCACMLRLDQELFPEAIHENHCTSIWCRSVGGRCRMRILYSATLFALAIARLAAAQQPPPAGAPAEQVYKNIQVLKGVPADQITPTMRVIARDLGVTCEYCHDEMDRSKDGVEAKDTARAMITMMRAINKDSFGGSTEDTCVY